jgi:hypothetical protein
VSAAPTIWSRLLGSRRPPRHHVKSRGLKSWSPEGNEYEEWQADCERMSADIEEHEVYSARPPVDRGRNAGGGPMGFHKRI